MSANDSYQSQRYLLMTLDPVHPGAGGYRLGRVDLSIARDPGTRLPKIPGSSLHGAARQYADLQARMNGKQEICAGQNSCGKPDCPICYTFGTVTKDKKGNEQIARSGVVSIFDAHILLFPVHTMLGPMWVSTVERLGEADFKDLPAAPEEGTVILIGNQKGNQGNPTRLNLGWLMLDVKTQVSLTPPEEWKNKQWEAIQDKIVLVNDSLFSVIVNSNLEVRTSVSIDPQTGAAAEGALYTYEAIPRATFLTLDVVQDDYRGKFPKQNGWGQPLDVVQAGLKLMEYLGVGGMGTRGFGRIRLIGKPLEISIFKDKTQEAAA
jgi:CRISPR-associated protein Cmr4